tara:strand:+ start:2682 stop:5225 length:2544 start_codon:yes stop_codon:yes gene_type:complete
MYKFILKHRVSSGKNLIDPYKIRQGYLPDAVTPLSGYDHTEKIAVSPGVYTYSESGTIAYPNRHATLFDNWGQIVDDDFNFNTEITIPSGVYGIKLAFQANENGLETANACFARLTGTPYETFYTSREVYPIYKSLKLDYDKSGTGEYYRRKLKGNLTLQKTDYNYISALPFDTEMFLEIEDSDSILEKYIGYFFKTDCKFNADNLTVEVRTKVLDDYEKVIGGMQKTYNLLELSPEIQAIQVNRRPIIQIYIPGDTVLTNILGGTHWEQELQIDPEFDESVLTNTHKFFKTQTIRNIPVSVGASLSTDVTGAYDDARLNANGLYRLIEDNPGVYWYGKRFQIQRVSDNAILYETPYTNWNATSVNSLLFSGVNGETGSFYFVEYAIFARYYTDILNTGTVDTYEIPSTDIVANNSNYKRVVGYNLGTTRFLIYEEFLTVPTKFGRVPDDAPDGGKYYRGLQLPASTGIDREPIPISMSNWKALSLWFLTDDSVQFTEYGNGLEFTLRDSFPLASAIQKLLSEMGANVSFLNDVEHSEFFYATTNPLGGFAYMGTYSTFNNPTNIGNLDYFITPKSNIINSTYDQPSKKADTSLQQILKMLADVFEVHWHIDNGRLRLEHISWYQKGGTYAFTPLIGTDLTTLQNVKNNKSWDFLQNNFEYDKEAMAERYEYGWMDDVSPVFQGNPINIISNFTQEGKIEDSNIGGFTTDIDFIQANPQEISKDGFVLIGAVNESGVYKVPYFRWYNPDGKQFMLQNGFLSWSYIHGKYHTSDLPSDRVNINGEDVILYSNITKQKKQQVKFPLNSVFNPYQLISTGLGDGKIEKISVDLESYMVSGTLKHDTDGNA